MPKQNVPPILKSVVEYDRVKRKTSYPTIMRQAADTPLHEAKNIHYFVARMCIHLDIPLPKVTICHSSYSWARPLRYQLGISLYGANVEEVLHELAHLLSPNRESLGTQRKTFHGSDFVKTLDRLLVVWERIR